MQSNPIGLEGGLNTYLYVDALPLSLIDPFGQSGGPIGWLVKLLDKGGMKLIKPVNKTEAVLARKNGENVLADRKQIAKQIEEAAADGGPVIKHPGHVLRNGKKGRPHFQRKGGPGHTFWNIAAGGAAYYASQDAEAVCPQPEPEVTWKDVIEWLVEVGVGTGNAN